MRTRILFALGLLIGAMLCAPAAADQNRNAPARAGPAAPAADLKDYPGQAVTVSPAEALKDYEVGKRAYDAGDYEAARRAFAAAARHDPGNPRWPYNLGLALRQLDQPNAARAAFLAARRLDPQYKRAEIGDKLTSMGFDARDSSATPKQPGARPTLPNATQPPSRMSYLFHEYWPFVKYVGGLGLLFIGFVITLDWITGIFARRKQRRTQAAAAKTATPPDPVKLEAESQRLMKLSAVLVAAEHAMRLGEDHDLRALLERATQLEHQAGEHLDAARAGDGSELGEATRLLDAAEPVAQQVQARMQALGADTAARGERVGCYFCARPLANADYRRRVPMSNRQDSAEVLACPVCADRIDRGETPDITVLGGKDGPRHWSEEPNFDPYVNRHAPYASAAQVPAWKFTPSRPLASLALLAAGGALGAGAAYAATRAFNLDAARESGLAQEAARAAARNAAERSGSDIRSSMRDSS